MLAARIRGVNFSAFGLDGVDQIFGVLRTGLVQRALGFLDQRLGLDRQPADRRRGLPVPSRQLRSARAVGRGTATGLAQQAPNCT
jgi:hypothetical protein